MEGLLEGEHIKVIIFGSDDEIYKMVTESLKKKNFGYIALNDIEKVSAELRKAGKYTVISWLPEDISLLAKRDISYINLLESI